VILLSSKRGFYCVRARRYVQRKDGDGFEVPVGELYRLRCCDCGLVHDVAFAIENGKLGMAARRNNRATVQVRASRARSSQALF
jgi:hypothetical protein